MSSSVLPFLLKSRRILQRGSTRLQNFSGETISRDMRRKDMAEESRYFAHEDYELLKDQARKAKRSADEVNPEKGKKLREKEKERGRQELKKLVPSLRDGDLTKILDWLHKDGTGARA